MEAVRPLLHDEQLINRLALVLSTPLELPFVNREEEVIDLSVRLILDSLMASRGTTDNQAYSLPFLPQMFGSGKTTIGKELLNQARKLRDRILNQLVGLIKDSYLTEELKRNIATLAPQQQAEAMEQLKVQQITEQVDKFLGATYVHITLDKLPRPSSNFPTFDDALFALIEDAFEEHGLRPSHELTSKDHQTIQKFVSALAGGRPVILHFDDVGSLLDYPKYHDFFTTMVDQYGVAIDAHPKWEMKRIYQLWNTIYLLNKMDGAYCFMSGKRSALIFLGLKLLDKDNNRPESPTDAIAIILSMFDARYIREIADKLHLWNYLGIADEGLKTRIVKTLQRLTGGVPRLVSWTMKVLMEAGRRLGDPLSMQQSEDDVRVMLRELLYAAFTYNRGSVLELAEMTSNPTSMDIYLRLLALSLRGKLIDKNMGLSFAGEDKAIPISVLVSSLDCYIDKRDATLWRLVFPELVLMWVRDNCRHQRLSFFTNWILEDPDIVSSGAVNEKVFRLSLETLFAPDQMEATLPPRPLGQVLSFFAHTELAEWCLRMQPNGFVPIPKVSESANQLTPRERSLFEHIASNYPREQWSETVLQLYAQRKHVSKPDRLKAKERDKLISFMNKTANFQDSELILRYMLPKGFLGCPTDSTSGWPDYVIVEPQQPRPLYALWWQVKLLGGEATLAWSLAQREINKVPLLATHGCLTIAVAGDGCLAPEILDCMKADTYLLLKPGNYSTVRDSSKHLWLVRAAPNGAYSTIVGPGKERQTAADVYVKEMVTGRRPRSSSVQGVLQVPELLEVVILGQRGIAELYSEYDLDGLQRLARANTFQSISRRIAQPQAAPVVGTAFAPAPIPGRTIKVTFVDITTNITLGSGMIDLPFGTTLDNTFAKIRDCLHKRHPTLSGREITGFSWNGVLIVHNDEVELIRDGHEILVGLK